MQPLPIHDLLSAPALPRITPARLALVLISCGLFYGAVMGSFSALSPERLLQLLYSAVKVPILLLVTFAIALPSFFVLNSLFGLRDDFADAVRALLATQAGLTIILASFAPFTALFYFSSDHYQAAILFNALMFGLASLSAQHLLRRFYNPLIQRNPRHRQMLRIWLLLYAFVGIQLAWLLRPFIGHPQTPTRFFRQDAWGNAYEVIAKMIWSLLE